MLQDLGVGVSALPPDVQQAPKAAEVESVESPLLYSVLLSGIDRPRLAAIKESRQDTCLVEATSWSFPLIGHCPTLAC